MEQLPDNGRGGGIRTHGLLVPNEARYQTAPRPDSIGEGGQGSLDRAGCFPEIRSACKRIFLRIF